LRWNVFCTSQVRNQNFNKHRAEILQFWRFTSYAVNKKNFFHALSLSLSLSLSLRYCQQSIKLVYFFIISVKGWHSIYHYLIRTMLRSFVNIWIHRGSTRDTSRVANFNIMLYLLNEFCTCWITVRLFMWSNLENLIYIYFHCIFFVFFFVCDNLSGAISALCVSCIKMKEEWPATYHRAVAPVCRGTLFHLDRSDFYWIVNITWTFVLIATDYKWMFLKRITSW